MVLQPVIPCSSGADARSPDTRLDETAGLALAISLNIVAQRAVVVTRPRPSTLFGGGVVDEVCDCIKAEEIDLVIVGWPLTPVQQRNLERTWKCKVIDRTGLILEIFGARARTREGQLQVELAALSYQRSRLVRSWTHLERQRGGFGFVGGPGERQIEIDRRLIDDRLARLKRELDQVRRTRGLHRKARARVPYPLIALAGYTNAGKSTLFNRVTAAEVFAEDMLFATLDPTMRQLELPSGRTAILSDTVGFISELPTDLVAAFRATLEEVTAADVIVHVRDCADPDECDECPARNADAEERPHHLGAGSVTGEDHRNHFGEGKHLEHVVEACAAGGHFVFGEALQPELTHGKARADADREYGQAAVEPRTQYARSVQRGRECNDARADHHDTLHDAEMARFEPHEVLHVQRDGHQSRTAERDDQVGLTGVGERQ